MAIGLYISALWARGMCKSITVDAHRPPLDRRQNEAIAEQAERIGGILELKSEPRDHRCGFQTPPTLHLVACAPHE
jgi:hypothetical protein